jgi:multidrug resistance efflux pump
MRRNIFLLILFTLILLTLPACDVFEDNEAVEPAPVVSESASIVSATGELVPITSANLSVSVPGVVDEILIGEGQNVQVGQELIILDGREQAVARVAVAELEFTSAQQALADLHDSSDAASAAAWLALLDARIGYNAAEEAWDELDQDDYQDDIDDAHEDVLEAEEELEDAQETFNRYSDLDEGNSLRKRYEDELQEAQEDYNEKVRIHSDLVIELERTEANWLAALAAVELAQADYEATLSGPDQDLLVLTEARLAAAEAQLEAAKVQVSNFTLSAPFEGTIARLNIHTGEYAAPGQPVLVLADLDRLQVETTDLNEIDVVQIEVGNLVTLTFDALLDEEFTGTVMEISPKSSEGLGVNYPVIIELDEIPDNARWGMTVFVDIEIGN